MRRPRLAEEATPEDLKTSKTGVQKMMEEADQVIL